MQQRRPCCSIEIITVFFLEITGREKKSGKGKRLRREPKLRPRSGLLQVRLVEVGDDLQCMS